MRLYVKKGDTKMRHYVLLGALACLAQMPALAQDTLSTSGQSLQGTWISRVALSGGDFQTFELRSKA